MAAIGMQMLASVSKGAAALALAAALVAPAFAQQAKQPPAPTVQPQTSPVVTTRGPSGGDIVGYGQIHHPEIGRGGMVVSQNEIATEVGVDILRKGGNAVDAAVATGFALAVTLPRAGNVGGGGYMVVHMAATGGKPAETIAIDYYGQAPAATTPDLLLNDKGKFDSAKGMSMKGVAIPGTVMGLWEAHRRYGKLKWPTLVAPAITLARKGVPLSDDEAEAHADQKKLMADDPAALAIFFRPDGSAWRAGDTFRQTDLAWTLTQIAKKGPDGFYKGPVADRIIAGMKAGGGIITAGDLADYKPIVTPPIWSSYRGNQIAYMPPTASGVTVAEAMNILERFPVKEMRWGSAEGLHTLAEAVKIASSDRRFVGGLPDWRTPSVGLASKEYAAERAKLIKPNKALDGKALPDGNPYPYESKDTTHFSVADQWGNAVSNTYTLSASYGAHVVAPGTGVLLNNSLGNLAWEKRPGDDRRSTQPVPGKRVGSTITPLIVFKDGQPWVISGTPGGGYIIATMVQLLSNVIDHDLNIAEAAQRPRINQGWADSPLEMETGFSPDLIPLLEKKGHAVKPSNTMGSVQSIMVERRPDGSVRFLGAADTRRPDALAAGVK